MVMEKGPNLQRSTASQKQSEIKNKDPSFYNNNINSLPEHSANESTMYDYQNDLSKLEIDCNYSQNPFKKAFASQSLIPNQLHNTSNHIPETQEDLIPHTFDLHDVIQKYGDHPEVLSLILSTKVEEDRRKAEEARLRQKELEYFILSKRDSLSNQAYSNRIDAYTNTCNDQHETLKIVSSKDSISPYTGKGKARQSLSNYDIDYLRSNTKELIESPYASAKYTQINNDQEQLSQPEAKRKRDINPSYKPSDTSDYFSLSYLTVTQPESSVSREKRHGSISHLLSPNETSENSSRQLQTVESLHSRRDSKNYAPTLPRSPYEEKPFINAIGTNTLPPINVSLQSHGRNEESSSSTANLRRDTVSSIDRPKRFKNIPNLDSFEVSILEALPFDDISDRSSSGSLQGKRKLSVPTENISYNDRSPPTINQQRSTSLDDDSSSSNIYSSSNVQATNNVISSSHPPKKLLLPPDNRLSKQNHSDLANRPRRRRREMQAISMIIETREFPYNDEYVWKNNGNTIHKSTGQKSIYYKCSNSMMGCPVNKTVTFRENGEYLIKYRGNHLNDCNKIKRVVNI